MLKDANMEKLQVFDFLWTDTIEHFLNWNTAVNIKVIVNSERKKTCGHRSRKKE